MKKEIVDYFKLRNLSDEAYANFKIPLSIKKVLPIDKQSEILEIGCGFGQLLRELKALGYFNLTGIDLSDQAVKHCQVNKIRALKVDLLNYVKQNDKKFDFIIMSHVLEHMEKNEIIDILFSIKDNLLSEKGQLLLIVPNAQSETGAYWRYEDFTHTTIFTSGSLFYVLKASGFKTILFIDPDCLEGLSLSKKIFKSIMLKLYKLNKAFWLRITSTAYHKSSPQIFSYEIKALAS